MDQKIDSRPGVASNHHSGHDLPIAKQERCADSPRRREGLSLGPTAKPNLDPAWTSFGARDQILDFLRLRV